MYKVLCYARTELSALASVCEMCVANHTPWLFFDIFVLSAMDVVIRAV